MAQQTVQTTDTLNEGRVKINSNFTELYSGATTANRQTDSYTLVLSDAGKLIEMNSASANNLTIPLNSTVAFGVGTVITVTQYGAGQTTIVATGGVTVRASAVVLTLPSQYSVATLVKIATNEWYLWNGVAINSVTDVAFLLGTTGLTLTNQANSEQYLGNSGFNRLNFDATGYSTMRIVCNVSASSASANSPRLYPQYSIDAGSNFVTIGAGTTASGEAISLSSTGFKTSNWITIPSAAKADVMFRIAQDGGDASASPAVGATRIQFKI